MNDMVKNQCPLCAGRYPIVFRGAMTRKFEGGTYEFYARECNHCKVGFFDPNASFEFRKAYHDFGYFVAQDGDQRGYPNYADPDHRGVKEDWGTLLLVWLQRLLSREPKSLLFLGPGLGYEMKAAIDRGLNVAAIEISEYAVDQIKALYGLSCYIYSGRPEQFQHSIKYDGVVCWDSFLQLDDPIGFLHMLQRNCTPDVRLILHLADYDCYWDDLEHPYWSPFQHCYHFNRTTLKSVLKKGGFKATKFPPSPQEGEILAWCKLLE